MDVKEVFKFGAVACLWGAGGLIPLTRAGEVEVSPGITQVTTQNQVGGTRVTRRPNRAREWNVTSDVPFTWARNVEAVATAGMGPFYWCAPDAQVHNLLASGFQTKTSGSPMLSDDGILLQVTSESSMPTPYAPVRPGLPVTAAVFGLGSGSMNLVFYDVSGAEVRRQTATASHDVLKRLSLTDVAPLSAVKARISAKGFTLMGGPSLTWTSVLTEYGAPAGCEKAVVTPKSWSYGALGRNGFRSHRKYSFTVQEVS